MKKIISILFIIGLLFLIGCGTESRPSSNYQPVNQPAPAGGCGVAAPLGQSNDYNFPIRGDEL